MRLRTRFYGIWKCNIHVHMYVNIDGAKHPDEIVIGCMLSRSPCLCCVSMWWYGCVPTLVRARCGCQEHWPALQHSPKGRGGPRSTHAQPARSCKNPLTSHSPCVLPAVTKACVWSGCMTYIIIVQCWTPRTRGVEGFRQLCTG